MSHPRVLDRASSIVVMIDVQEAYRGVAANTEELIRNLGSVGAPEAREDVIVSWL